MKHNLIVKSLIPIVLSASMLLSGCSDAVAGKYYTKDPKTGEYTINEESSENQKYSTSEKLAEFKMTEEELNKVTSLKSVVGDFDISALQDEINSISDLEVDEDGKLVNPVEVKFKAVDSVGHDKYLSDYPNALGLLNEKDAMESEYMVYFKLLDQKDANTFVYAYQTLEYANSNSKSSEISSEPVSEEKSGFVFDNSKSKTETPKALNVLRTVVMEYQYTSAGPKVKEYLNLTEENVDIPDGATKPEKQTIFANTLYKSNKANGDSFSTNGYFVYINSKCYFFDKDGIQVNVIDVSDIERRSFEEKEEADEEEGETPSYEIISATACGDVKTHASIQLGMMISNKVIADDTMNNEELDEDDLEDEGVVEYAIYISYDDIANQTITVPNANFSNQKKAYSANAKSGKVSSDDASYYAKLRFPSLFTNPKVEYAGPKTIKKKDGDSLVDITLGKGSYSLGTDHVLMKGDDYYAMITGTLIYGGGTNQTVYAQFGDTKCSTYFTKNLRFTLNNAFITTYRIEEEKLDCVPLFDGVLASFEGDDVDIRNYEDGAANKNAKFQTDEGFDSDIASVDVRIIESCMYLVVVTEESVYVRQLRSVNSRIYPDIVCTMEDVFEVEKDAIFFETTKDYSYNANLSGPDMIGDALSEQITDEDVPAIAMFEEYLDGKTLADKVSEKQKDIDKTEEQEEVLEEYNTSKPEVKPERSSDNPDLSLDIQNPDNYPGYSFYCTPSGEWYLCSLYSGLIKFTVDDEEPQNIEQVSTYSCYTMVREGSSYYVMAYDNIKGIYADADIVQSKRISYEAMLLGVENKDSET